MSDVISDQHPLAERLLRPIRRFAAYGPSSGIVLVMATALAVLWANSAGSLLPGYADFWNTELSLRLGDVELSLSLHEWIDEALMALFFFHVSLEVKYEFLSGALSTRDKAVLPVVAALGGMLAPVAVFLILNLPAGDPGGWAVPMATDVAFAIALLTLLGKRVPASWRAFLLALAVIDDVGTVAVIALFYSAKITTIPLLVVAFGLALVYAMRRAGVHAFLVYWLVGAAIWLAMEKSGVHPTVAGVLLGFLTPLSTPRHTHSYNEQAAERIPHLLREAPSSKRRLLEELERVRRGALSPLNILQHRLEPWVLFVIMPAFALANAGVDLSEISLADNASLWVLVGSGVGLVVGKPLGIVTAVRLATLLSRTKLPDGLSWSALTGLGLLAGVGFAIALFLTSLAFTDPAIASAARVGILAGSLIAALAGLGLLWLVLHKNDENRVAQSKHVA